MENNNPTRTTSRRLLRGLDNWTLYAFNPTFPRYERALTDAIARQEDTHRETGDTSMPDGVRRVLRRLDDWTLTVFNPHYPSDHRRN